MAQRKRGFGTVVIGGMGKDDIGELRRGMRRDIRKAMEKIDTDEDKGKKSVSDTLKAISEIDAWRRWDQVQQNISSRLQALGSYVEQTGTNAGKIVIPTTFDTKARQLLGEAINGYVGLSVDVYNGFSADRALTVWGLLSNGLGMGGLGESIFGSLLFLQFAGNGLNATSMFSGPGIGGYQNQLLIGRTTSAILAVL